MDYTVKTLDHLGIIAGTMNDLQLADLIDNRLLQDSQTGLSCGNAVKAMIVNGLGFSNRVLSLTPQFFTNKPVDLLIGEDVKAEQINRHKLGRTLDRIAAYGCDRFFNELALILCVSEGIDINKIHNDTTTFSVEGSYEKQDENAVVHVAHGYSKAKRPDLKQIILELCVSPDGSIPFMMKPWSGNSSDNTIFNERIKELKEAAIESNKGIILIGDSKLYTEKNIRALGEIYFITRVPATNKEVEICINKAITGDSWSKKDDNYKLQAYAIEQHGTKMRWIVFYSEHAQKRAVKSVKATVAKQEERLRKDLFHLAKQKFNCASDAERALAEIIKNYPMHRISCSEIISINKHAKTGRPSKKSINSLALFKIKASFESNDQEIKNEIERRACFILATNIPENALSHAQVLDDYKEQDHVEKGFQFMKTPHFFASSFFVKSAKRIQAMLVIMTLALLIYTIAQRRFRKWLHTNKKTIPNQIGQPISRPTLRWAFQLLEGIYYVGVCTAEKSTQMVVHGLNELRIFILSCFGENVMRIYRIDNINTTQGDVIIHNVRLQG
jgi:transposase